MEGITITMLKKAKFQQRFLEDNSGSWWVRKINHKYLGALEITVDTDWITITLIDSKDPGNAYLSRKHSGHNDIRSTILWITQKP